MKKYYFIMGNNAISLQRYLFLQFLVENRGLFFITLIIIFISKNSEKKKNK